MRRPVYNPKEGVRIVLPDTGLSLEIANRIAATKTDCIFDELRILDEMALAWWIAKHRINDDRRLDRTLLENVNTDEFDLSLSIESHFDGLDDEEMDRDMEFYEANELAHRLTQLAYAMVDLTPLINRTFNVALLSGVNLDDARIVGIEKAGVYPVMFVE